jgi:hypothetical protein
MEDNDHLNPLCQRVNRRRLTKKMRYWSEKWKCFFVNKIIFLSMSLCSPRSGPENLCKVFYDHCFRRNNKINKFIYFMDTLVIIAVP